MQLNFRLVLSPGQLRVVSIFHVAPVPEVKPGVDHHYESQNRRVAFLLIPGFDFAFYAILHHAILHLSSLFFECAHEVVRKRQLHNQVLPDYHFQKSVQLQGKFYKIIVLLKLY